MVAITPAARPAAAASALEAPTAIMGLSLKVDSKTSVAGKTIALVVARAGVEDKIALSEGAAAIELDAGPDGQLEGLATVAKFVASLSADAAALDGTIPEEQATVAEWCQRAVAEYGATGAVTDDKLEALDAHLLKRSYIATRGASPSRISPHTVPSTPPSSPDPRTSSRRCATSRAGATTLAPSPVATLPSGRFPLFPRRQARVVDSVPDKKEKETLGR